MTDTAITTLHPDAIHGQWEDTKRQKYSRELKLEFKILDACFEGLKRQDDPDKRARAIARRDNALESLKELRYGKCGCESGLCATEESVERKGRRVCTLCLNKEPAYVAQQKAIFYEQFRETLDAARKAEPKAEQRTP